MLDIALSESGQFPDAPVPHSPNLAGIARHHMKVVIIYCSQLALFSFLQLVPIVLG
jgi:hypothetical protein